MTRFAIVMAAALVSALGACHRSPPNAASNASAPSPPTVTNRIDLPASVRANLGITFARVERRNVERTIRVPGRFEIPPDARREYRAMLAGTVELHVSQFDRIEPGQRLYTLDSPAWRELQETLSQTQSQILQAQARADAIDPLMAAHEHHHDELKAGVEIWAERVRQLEHTGSTGAVTAEELARTRSQMVNMRAQLAEVLEKEAELQSRKAEVQAQLIASRERFDLLLSNASSLAGVSKEELLSADSSGVPQWRAMARVHVRAAAAGIVESVAATNGSWLEQSDSAISVICPENVRFHAHALQSDLIRLEDGLQGRILPSERADDARDAEMTGLIRLGLIGHADDRTVDLYMTPTSLASWARPGVTAHLEIVAAGAAAPALAIPSASIIRDGLQTVLFRRDPANPDKVIRVVGDLGLSDGRWTVILSGVKEGDEVVLDGVYPLMLASSGSQQKGGHFHADGTWHAGDK